MDSPNISQHCSRFLERAPRSHGEQLPCFWDLNVFTHPVVNLNMNQLLLWLFEARFRLFIKGITEKPRHDNRNRPCQLSPHRFFESLLFWIKRKPWLPLGEIGRISRVWNTLFGFFPCSLDQVSFANKRNQPLGVASFYRHRIFLKYVSEEKGQTGI